MNLQSRIMQLDVTSKRTRVFIQDSTTFMGKTALAWNTAGLTFYYSNGPSDTAHAIALVTQTVGGAYTAGGFVEVDATHEPGWYQLDVPDTFGVSGSGFEGQIVWKGTGVLDGALDVDFTSYNPNAIDKSNFTLSSAGIQAIWQQLTDALTLAGSIGKLLSDNVQPINDNVVAIKAKTDPLTLVSGGVELHAHGMDSVIGYHPAGDA